MTPARSESLAEVREVFFRRIVGIFWFFLCVQVVQIAEEFIKAVVGRQELVAVPEVVLAELSSYVALGLECSGDRGIFVAEAQIGAGHSYLGQPGAIRVLARDECSSTRGAALFTVVIGEHRTFLGDPVDVRRLVSHQTIRVATQVADTDVIAPQHQNVRLSVWHGFSLLEFEDEM